MSEHPHLYDRRWRKARARFLAEHPLCMCPHCNEGRKRVRVAQVVDHRIPHKGDLSLFWDESNWQAMARTCHDSYKQSLEKSGYMRGADANGNPWDPMHAWNVERR